MKVVINSKGEFAKVTESSTVSGTKKNLYWGELDNATLFQNTISVRDNEGIYDKLMEGIQISADVERKVTLTKKEG